MRPLAHNEARPEKVVQAINEIYGERGYGVYASSGVAGTPLTGTTAETALATIKIPGRLMGPNGAIRVMPIFSIASSANQKVVRLRFGGLAGTSMGSFSVGVGVAIRALFTIQNRNSAGAQLGYDAVGLGSTANALITATLDTTVEQELVISGQLANAGDSITLQAYIVEVLRRG